MSNSFSSFNGYEVKDENARNKNDEQDLKISSIEEINKEQDLKIISIEEVNKTMRTRIDNLDSSKLDKNVNESITWEMIGQDVKEQITGGNTAVVGANSVNTTNIVDGAVTHNKLSNTLKYQIAKNSACYLGKLTKIELESGTYASIITYELGYIRARLNETGSPIQIKIPAGTKIVPNEGYLVVNLDEYTTYGQEIEPIIYTKQESQSALYNGNYIILFINNHQRYGGIMYNNYLEETHMSQLDENIKKSILKSNVLLSGSIISATYDTLKATITYDRSYLTVQQSDVGSPLFNIIPSATVELPSPGYLVVKMSDMSTKGAEITPMVLDSSFSATELFNGDYIILLSNYYGRLGGLFAQTTFGLSNASADVTQDDTRIYLKVNSESSITLLKKCTESDTSYLGFDFNRIIDESKNSDIWRIYGLKKYDKSGASFISNTTAFMTTGEIEAAIKISGAPDYVGGSIHGYEKTKNIEIYIDGKLIDVSKIGVYSGKNIVINRISEMYDYGTTNLFAIHNCIYEFNNDGLTLNQNLDFKLSKPLLRSYLGMNPVVRKIGEHYVTNKAVFFPTLENIEVYENHENTAQRTGVSGVLLTNKEDSGYNFMSKTEVLEQNVPELAINISNAEIYNKIYPSICGDSYNVNPNEKWSIKTKYTFDYKGLSN